MKYTFEKTPPRVRFLIALALLAAFAVNYLLNKHESFWQGFLSGLFGGLFFGLLIAEAELYFKKRRSKQAS